MQGVRRSLFTLASAVSLLLFVATVVEWVRSHRYEHTAQLIRNNADYSVPLWWRRRITLASAGGTVVIDGVIQSLRGSENLDEIKRLAEDPLQQPFEFASRPLKHPQPLRIGIRSAVPWHGFVCRIVGFAYGHRYTAAVPMWSIALVAAILPTTFAFGWVRRKKPAGACGNCSYDLTGNTSGVCPECGTAVGEQQKASASSPAMFPEACHPER